MRKLSILLFTIVAASAFVVWQPANAQSSVQQQTRAYHQKQARRILEEFVELLRVPNLASDRNNIRRNAELIAEMMKRRGLTPRLLEASDPNAPPAVYAELRTPGATRTVMLYAHYDGQPTDARQWTETKPWEPAFRTRALEAGGKLLSPGPNESIDPEWRLYARSAADDKAGVMAILVAIEALTAQGIKPTTNLKFFFEGEEEAGSPHLKEIIDRNKELLAADAWLICDGPVHQSGRKQVVFGVRGDINVDLTVYGAKRPLHSGHYGNWAPNPALLLARLLASMKDESGRVTIAGWYDDVAPLGEAERRAIANAPAYDEELRSQLGFARSRRQEPARTDRATFTEHQWHEQWRRWRAGAKHHSHHGDRGARSAAGDGQRSAAPGRSFDRAHSQARVPCDRSRAD
jgi:acetylornithine deacetylase/succinyl-diaminopimelate desuccinylase-like protein